MRLATEFIRLPLAFDVERLREEVAQFGEYDWDYHPQRYDGNTALSLISKHGERSDSYTGEMRATPMLKRCPYIQQVMHSLNTVLGRSRLMRIAPFKGVPAHCDTDYSWRDRVRIHIPIVTDPNIRFSSIGNTDVHMAAGEAWIFDNWRAHEVINEANVHRVHLVIDTIGTSKFWRLVAQGMDPRNPPANWEDSIQRIEFQPERKANLRIEKVNLLPVRSPAELSAMLNEICDDLKEFKRTHPKKFELVRSTFDDLLFDWRALWAEHWDEAAAIDLYAELITKAQQALAPTLAEAKLDSNLVNADSVVINWLAAMIDVNARQRESQDRTGVASKLSYAGKVPEFTTPVFIVAAPRSGSTMLFEALKNNKELWTIGDESHQEFESIAGLHPRDKGWTSNALEADDATSEVRAQLLNNFMFKLQNVRCQLYVSLPPEFQIDQIRFLEKTPKNALRIPFLKALFPDAKFIYLHREARPNIGSIIDAWKSGNFVTYRNLANRPEQSWSLLLNDDWQSVLEQPLASKAAFQWSQSNLAIAGALSELAPSDWCAVSYESLLAEPGAELFRLCEFAQLPFGPRMQAYARDGFPHSKYVVTAPDREKWRRYETEINQAEPWFVDAEKELKAFFAD